MRLIGGILLAKTPKEADSLYFLVEVGHNGLSVLSLWQMECFLSFKFGLDATNITVDRASFL